MEPWRYRRTRRACCRPAVIQRRSSLLRMSFSKSWLATITMVLAGSWLGFFRLPRCRILDGLWWQFSYDGTALCFMGFSCVVTVAYGLFRLWGVAPPQLLLKPTEAELTEARRILVGCADTQGFLALLGDKYLFWNRRNAFIMFAAHNPILIAMGDPVGEQRQLTSCCINSWNRPTLTAPKRCFTRLCF